MLEKLTEIIRQQIETLTIGNEQFKGLNIEEAISETFKTFQSGFSQAILNGKIAEVIGAFAANSDLAKNPVVDELVKKLTESLSTKGGLSFKNAFELSSELIPKIIEHVKGQIQEKTKGFDANSIINSLTGSKGNINFDEVLKNIENKVGKVDLNELAQKFITDQKENSNKFFDTLSKLISKEK